MKSQTMMILVNMKDNNKVFFKIMKKIIQMMMMKIFYKKIKTINKSIRVKKDKMLVIIN